MENIKKRLGNLLAVKSLVTITLTVIFAVLALRESISGSEFLTIFTVVIGFYFGTQRVNEDKNG
jgi:drug/metabolite transporter (DMT)-like permease